MAKKELINASLGDPLFPFSKALRHAQGLVADNSRTYHFNTTSPIVNGEYRDACTPIKTHFTSMGFKSTGYNGVILPDIMPVDGGTSRAFHMILHALSDDVVTWNKSIDWHNHRYGQSIPAIQPVIIMPVPTYGHFLDVARNLKGVECVTLERDRANNWAVNPQELDDLLTRLRAEGKRVVAYFDSNPHNPTGYVRDKKATYELANVIHRHSQQYKADEKQQNESAQGNLFTTPEYLNGLDLDEIMDAPHDRQFVWEGMASRIRVIDDTVYNGLEYKDAPKPFSFAQIPEFYHDCFVITGPSKLGLAGMRAGLIIANDRDTYELQKIDRSTGYCPSVMTLKLLSAIYNDAAENTKWRTDYLKKATDYYRYAGLFVKAMINGLGDVIDDIDPATIRRMKADICRAKKCTSADAQKILASGIDGIRVATSPDAGFFHLVDFSALIGTRYDDGYSYGKNARTFEDEHDIERLQKHFNLATASGNYTGLPGEQCLRRVTFAMEPAALVDLVDRLRSFAKACRREANTAASIAHAAPTSQAPV